MRRALGMASVRVKGGDVEGKGRQGEERIIEGFVVRVSMVLEGRAWIRSVGTPFESGLRSPCRTLVENMNAPCLARERHCEPDEEGKGFLIYCWIEVRHAEPNLRQRHLFLDLHP